MTNWVFPFLFLSVCQEFSAVSALELLVRANITVKSSIKHLVLRDAAAQVLSRARVGLQNMNPQKQNDDIVLTEYTLSS